MKRSIPATLSAVALAAAAGLLISAPQAAFAGGTAKPAPASKDKVARGQYLVTIAGCHDCHTPFKMGAGGPEPDMSRALSGHPAGMTLPPPPKPEGPWITSVAATNTAWAGPWGVSFTANLTPDAETGLGKWTERNFKDTMRTGRRMGRGREILPPMPIPMYKHMNDADLEAIYAYLQSIPAIANPVPEPLPPQGR
jgi:mono/diheme cytochrome c family protein